MKININKLRAAIDKWSMEMGAEDIHIEIPDNSSKKREHLGMSAIGTECIKAAFFMFRKVGKPKFPPRMLRLFQRGHREEFFIEHMLRGVGLTIWNVDPKTGKQFHVSDFEDHFQGSMDGVAKDKEELYSKGKKPFKLEYKTYNDSRFNKLVKVGLKKSDPKYWKQIHSYLGYQPKLKGCLFIAVNKNDDQLEILWIEPCESTFLVAKSKAERVINAQRPPKGIGYSFSDYRCSYCDFKENCFKDKPSLKSCRSCRFARPAEKGTWICKKGKDYGTLCKQWKDINR